MKHWAAAAIVLFSALLVSEAVADLQACARAFAQKDWAAALRECRPAAEQGHAGAQFTLGVMYGYGMGVPQDHREAARWYRPVAEQGDAAAQFLLGAIYAEGEGVPQDHPEALKWFRLAAEQGDAGGRSPSGGCTTTAKGSRRITRRR